MRHLYDFGISQEDPLTEFHVLDIQENDHVLCIASGGEVPLTLLCLRPGVKITAVDISPEQLALCRLKLQAAISLPFPQNGAFLGYAASDSKSRRETYFEKIHPHLLAEDQDFWLANLAAIEKGVINFGRFERFIKYLRKIVTVLIGKNNLLQLIACTDISAQQTVFDTQIGNRRAVKYLFRIAFHPAVYKKRGLRERALMHAPANTGELFFNKFRNFCTATPASMNYFLQYFLLGACTSNHGLPEYLHEKNRNILMANRQKLIFRQTTLQEELASDAACGFNKVHLSNIGDWMSEEAFDSFLRLLQHSCSEPRKLCYRFLQKNHFESSTQPKDWYDITPFYCETTDRFPFYSVLAIRTHG